jgi:hypothetical protein
MHEAASVRAGDWVYEGEVYPPRSRGQLTVGRGCTGNPSRDPLHPPSDPARAADFTKISQVRGIGKKCRKCRAARVKSRFPAAASGGRPA